MRLAIRTAVDYADAQRALLPPGAAFDWPQGGFGDALLLGMAQELSRVGASTQQILDNAVVLHRPKVTSWHIDEYRRIANAAIVGIAETLPRKPFTVGAKVGQRIWSSAAAASSFPIELMRIDQLIGPLRVGSRVGDGAWGSRSRYVLRVRYYRSVIDPKLLWDALVAFKQAHVFLWFQDITGSGGEYGQN